MDKTGIFKLLTALFDYYRKNSMQNTNDKNSFSAQENGDKTLTPSPSLDNFIKNLSPLLNGGKDKAVEQKKEFTAPLPLQQNMLNVMRSHDEFIKRVENNQQKKRE